MSASAMSGICTSNRCGIAMSSASIRATTSYLLAASPASRAGPRPRLRSSGTGVTGTGQAAHNSLRHRVSSLRTGPSRTITTWAGGRVCSSTALRKACRR